jgi:CheY-like chemotaxis protein
MKGTTRMTLWMVVEDEPDLYEMVLAMYGLLGVDGLAFVTGEEAIAWLDEVDNGSFADEIPEVALVDIRLPGRISGIDVAARMRENRMLSNIPIVLMTAYRMSYKEEQMAMRRSGADRLLRKPLPHHQKLRDIFNQIMRQRQSF